VLPVPMKSLSVAEEFPATMSTIGAKPNLKFVGNCTEITMGRARPDSKEKIKPC